MMRFAIIGAAQQRPGVRQPPMAANRRFGEEQTHPALSVFLTALHAG